MIKSRIIFTINNTAFYELKSDTYKFLFEEVNTLDIAKTKSYYNQIRSEELCDCDYYRNNIHS